MHGIGGHSPDHYSIDPDTREINAVENGGHRDRDGTLRSSPGDDAIALGEIADRL